MTRPNDRPVVARLWFEALNKLQRYHFGWGDMDKVPQDKHDDTDTAYQFLAVSDVRVLLERYMSPASEKLHARIDELMELNLNELCALAKRIGYYHPARMKKAELARGVAEFESATEPSDG